MALGKGTASKSSTGAAMSKYDVEVELIPIRQELRAKAILKFSPNGVEVNEVFLQFNGNLTVDRSHHFW